MIKIHNVDQVSDEWFELRKGKMTGSNATAVGANGKGLETYCKKISIGIIREEKEEQYSNADIERGKELESIGLTTYEFETGVTVENVGFITNDIYKNVGCSPDGLVGLDGGIEIKARNDEKHFSLIQGETKEIPFNQIQMCLLVTERKWWDFISINVNFDKPIFILRVFPDEKYFDKLKKGFDKGNDLIEKYCKNYANYRNL